MLRGGMAHFFDLPAGTQQQRLHVVERTLLPSQPNEHLCKQRYVSWRTSMLSRGQASTHHHVSRHNHWSAPTVGKQRSRSLLVHRSRNATLDVGCFFRHTARVRDDALCENKLSVLSCGFTELGQDLLGVGVGPVVNDTLHEEDIYVALGLSVEKALF